jgi:tRNA1Val (adenine37-N6)-methyltransferase
LGEFQFKYFTLFHNQDSFSIGTDAMVLGALVQGQDDGRILDAGAGSGVLGLMAAQKFPLSHVDCVEIDGKAFLECQENLRKSPFHGRIRAIRSNLMDFQPKELYTTVITNPPYYCSDNFSTPRNQREKHISTEELFTWFMHCSQLLAPQGTLWFIIPMSIKKAVELILERLEMHIHREIQVQNQHGITVRIVLGVTQQSLHKESSTLKLRNEDGSYSNEYIDLTAEFHAKPLQKQLKLHET